MLAPRPAPERLAARDVEGARDTMRRHIHRKSGPLREELDRRGVLLDTRLFDTALAPSDACDSDEEAGCSTGV